MRTTREEKRAYSALGGQRSSVRYAPKRAIKNCKKGDITIINASQPIKLALGS